MWVKIAWTFPFLFIYSFIYYYNNLEIAKGHSCKCAFCFPSIILHPFYSILSFLFPFLSNHIALEMLEDINGIWRLFTLDRDI